MLRGHEREPSAAQPPALRERALRHVRRRPAAQRRVPGLRAPPRHRAERPGLLPPPGRVDMTSPKPGWASQSFLFPSDVVVQLAGRTARIA